MTFDVDNVARVLYKQKQTIIWSVNSLRLCGFSKSQSFTICLSLTDTEVKTFAENSILKYFQYENFSLHNEAINSIEAASFIARKLWQRLWSHNFQADASLSLYLDCTFSHFIGRHVFASQSAYDHKLHWCTTTKNFMSIHSCHIYTRITIHLHLAIPTMGAPCFGS